MDMDAHEEKYTETMMKAVDGLLSEEEMREWESYLSGNPSAAKEFGRLSSTANYMSNFRERELYAYRAKRKRKPNRLLAWSGFGLLMTGLVVIAAVAVGPALTGAAVGRAGFVVGGVISLLGAALLCVKLLRA